MICKDCIHRHICSICNMLNHTLKTSSLSLWMDDIKLEIVNCKDYEFDINSQFWNTSYEEIFSVTEEEYADSLDMLLREFDRYDKICS
ncbi:hypothetical protein [Thermobrachium celere]|uniref:hypothetical protein n=1 Tax=Thermobrachium celere TaxID=53422 RepID=UPI0019423047|nr:hypothetical protein [Thermobrachium celere]GFR35920.1 hypothetical protein TCEA9_17320 [Thermobrachium celere]